MDFKRDRLDRRIYRSNGVDIVCVLLKHLWFYLIFMWRRSEEEEEK